MIGLAGWLCLRANAPSWTWIYVLGGAIVVEGTPIWGPGPVIAAELGALGLLSVAAFKHDDRDAQQHRTEGEHDRGLHRDGEHLPVDRQPEAVDVRQP